MSLVMPVSAWMAGGIVVSGLTSVDHSEVTSKPSTSSTAISVTRSCAGWPPVVSRSTIASGASSCMRPPARLLHFDVGFADHFRPARRVGADALDELLRRAAHRLGADRVEALEKVGRLEGRDDFLLQAVHDLGRR